MRIRDWSRWGFIGLVSAWLACPVPASAQLIVGSGASLSLGDGIVQAGCHDLRVGGTLDIGAGTLRGVRDVSAPGVLRGGNGVLELTGELAAAPGFLPQTGSVRLVEGCARDHWQISGAHDFHRLSVQGNAGNTLFLRAGETQDIADALLLYGGAQRLLLRSTAPGNVALLQLAGGGTQDIARVNVRDVGAPVAGQWLAPLSPASYDSIDAGNSPRFFGEEPVEPIPAVGSFALLLMILTISLIAFLHLPSMFRGIRR
jgi:hypothetical protein